MFFIGDFNLPGISWEDGKSDSRGRPILEAATVAGLEQMVEGPTHTRGNRLDLILTNAAEKVIAVHDEGRLGNSDHIMLKIQIEVGELTREEVASRLNWKRADFISIRRDLDEVDWRSEFEGRNTQEKWIFFSKTILDAIEIHVPKSKGAKVNRRKWVTNEIVGLLRKKKNAWKKYKKDRSMRNKSEYDDAAKKVKYAVRRAKAKMEKDLAFRNEDNGKKFRDYIQSRTKTRPRVGPLVDDGGNSTCDSQEMANILNRYFGTVFTQENLANIPVKPRETRETLGSIEIHEKDIREKIANLKTTSAPGPDKIGPRILQETSKIISYPLKLIFESSLREQKCPKEWKIATVVPIYKKGPKGKPENYRPVSLTSIVCKVFESIIKDNMDSHLEKNLLIKNSQHGFRKGLSCATNLI